MGATHFSIEHLRGIRVRDAGAKVDLYLAGGGEEDSEVSAVADSAGGEEENPKVSAEADVADCGEER